MRQSFLRVLQVDLSVMTLALEYVDLTDSRFVVAVLCIALNPLFWNLVRTSLLFPAHPLDYYVHSFVSVVGQSLSFDLVLNQCVIS